MRVCVGDQAADEEGVHPGVLQRQEVHVCVLFPYQGQILFIQDVCQGANLVCHVLSYSTADVLVTLLN